MTFHIPDEMIANIRKDYLEASAKEKCFVFFSTKELKRKNLHDFFLVKVDKVNYESDYSVHSVELAKSVNDFPMFTEKTFKLLRNPKRNMIPVFCVDNKNAGICYLPIK